MGDIRTSLASFPALAAVYDRLLAELRDRRVAVVVRGSLGRRQMDRFSDIDLTLVVPDLEPDGSLLERDLLRRMHCEWTVLSHFTAAHIGLDRLHVLFLDAGDTVVKVDLEVASARAWRRGIEDTVAWDPEGLTGPADEPFAAPAPDAELLATRMCGWLWYTATKIERGELFEAVSSLDIMRRHGLVPLLLLRLGLPQEDYRRLEWRLPAAVRSRLARSFPRGVHAPELRRALFQMQHWFMSLCDEDDVSHERRERLRRMWTLARSLPGRADHA